MPAATPMLLMRRARAGAHARTSEVERAGAVHPACDTPERLFAADFMLRWIDREQSAERAQFPIRDLLLMCMRWDYVRPHVRAAAMCGCDAGRKSGGGGGGGRGRSERRRVVAEPHCDADVVVESARYLGWL